VSPQDGVLDSLVLPEGNADTMSLFLAEVARRPPHEFIFRGLDGAGWHRAGDLILPERRRLYPVPARRPQLNPTEQVGDERREKGLANRIFDGQEAVDCPVQKGWAALEQDRSRVASLAGFTWIKRISLSPQ
jgi:hypothetical protein